MEADKRCIRHLQECRNSLRNFYLVVIRAFISDILEYAKKLDAAYKDIKISKVAGQSGCVFGGVLSVVGFGLSFATFGASLGLLIAGGVIGGMGGVTSGGASIGEYVRAKEARNKTQEQRIKCEQAFKLLLEKCKDISVELERSGPIDTTFPEWKKFWGNIVLGSGRVAAGFGWKMVANTVLNAVRIGRGIDVATDVTSASVPVFRTLGTASKGFHIAGGVVSAVSLPIDVYLLVSNSVELHNDTSHGDSKRIREIATEMQKKCPTKKEIDDMIDDCILAVGKKIQTA